MSPSPRHPEVAERSEAPEGRRPGPFFLRGSLRPHLRMTVVDWCRWHKSVTVIGLAFGVACSSPGEAQEFYRNKQLRMIVGHGVGNDYDLAGRFLARYLAKHIPGHPTIVVQNLPQAASIAAANFLYAQAPRDGTVFGSFSRNVPSQALMGQANLEVDPRRFNWLGATSLPARVCVRWVTAPVKSSAGPFH